MKKHLSSNLGLKIISGIIAVSLWFYVVQVQNPDMVRTIKGVPVVFTQRASLEEKDLIFLNDNEHTIDVEIRGSRKYVTDVDNENITVLADVSSIETAGRHIVFTNVVLPYANLEILSKNPTTLSVDVDDLVSVEMPVEVFTEGSPKDSYVVGNLTANPDSVTVTGPKTIVDGIQSVAAVVDVSGKSADTAGMETLHVFGSSNKEIKNQLLSFSKDEIEVHTEILRTKTVDMELVFAENAQGIAAEYVLDENSIKEVRIAGVQALVDIMDTIRTMPISESDFSENGEVAVKLDLPQGVRSLDGDSFTLRFTRRPPEE